MEKLTKKQPISTLKQEDLINDIFVIKDKRSVSPYRHREGGEGYCFTLTLSDSSGKNIEYKYWGSRNEEKVKEVFAPIKSDSVILINGKVGTYKERLEIHADESSTLRVLNPEEYEAEFIMAAKKDIEEMYSSLLLKINSIQNDSLKRFLLDIFESDLKEKFKKHPGAMQIHHNWIGGLLQHTLEVIEYCETSIKLNPELNRDLLLTGAIFHDIGKLEELEITSKIKWSRKGYLLGHLTLGAIFLSEKLKESELDELLKEKLLHLLISNHGKLDLGSPKEPMIPEAIALYYADELASKLSDMIEFIKESKETTDEDFMFNRRGKINIFLN